MPAVRVLSGGDREGQAVGAPDPRGPDLLQRPEHPGGEEDPLAGRRARAVDADQVSSRAARIIRPRRPRAGGPALRRCARDMTIPMIPRGRPGAASRPDPGPTASALRVAHVILSMDYGGLE